MQKIFWGRKSSSKLTVKNKVPVVVAVIILEVVNNWRSMLQIKIREKVTLWNWITFHYRKSMLPLQQLSDWHLHGMYISQEFEWVIESSQTVITWINFWVFWLLQSALEHFGFPWTPAGKATHKNWLGALG